MGQRALIILHPGFEEMEACAPIDLLSRASVEVVQASTSSSLKVKGRSGITLEASCLLCDVADQNFDVVILPGGPGITKLRKHTLICECIRRHLSAEKIVACICAAPLLLLDAGVCKGIDFTAHPSTSEELQNASQQSIVIDGNIITSRGAGTATEFALAIVEVLTKSDVANEIADSICWPHSIK